MTEYADIDKVLSELRHGHSCLLLNENSAGGMTGFVVVAAEHCEAEHIAFMARQARGLVCLAMTPQRCEELEDVDALLHPGVILACGSEGDPF